MAVFFDLDGTLTDPKLGITRCIQHALEALDEPAPAIDELTWCIGPPLRESFLRLVGEQRADQAVAHYRDRFGDVGLFENDPYPEIHDTLAQLRERGVELFVASSKPLVFVERILERFGLAGFFTQAYGSRLDGALTDKTQLLAHALRDSGVTAEQATMIGDRSHDAVGAANNKVAFVGVLYGYGDRAELESAGARVLVDAHQQLPEVVP